MKEAGEKTSLTKPGFLRIQWCLNCRRRGLGRSVGPLKVDGLSARGAWQLGVPDMSAKSYFLQFNNKVTFAGCCQCSKLRPPDNVEPFPLKLVQNDWCGLHSATTFVCWSWKTKQAPKSGHLNSRQTNERMPFFDTRSVCLITPLCTISSSF